MNKKCFYIVGAAIVLLMGLIAFPASSIADGKGCSFQGSWYGMNADNELEWIVNVQGQSQTSGTSNLESPGFDPSFYGNFPDAVELSSLKGVWERTSKNTFSMTLIGIASDIYGQTVWVGKMIGTTTLSDDCNSEVLNLTLEFLGPDMAPVTVNLGGPDLYWIPLPTHDGYRITVDSSPQ